MKKLIIFLITFSLTYFKSINADTIYNGTLIDAHSQVGILITDEEVSKEINNNDVYLTLLSMRGKHENATKRYKSIQKQTQGKVRYLISTKLKGFARKKRDANEAIKGIKELKRQAVNSKINYVGFGEIIVQHAPHDHEKLKYEGINLNLKSYRIKKAIDIILEDDSPIILHVELNDYEEDSKKILNQLVEIGNKHPNKNFLLMHMAQIEIEEAKLILKNTNNVHFITSHSDPYRAKNEKRKRLGTAQTGWITLFNKKDNLKKKWKNLMNENPHRFVFALDNVFDHHWKKKYKERIYFWRKALASLNKDTALLVACGNANNYFKLEVKCK
jgi:predicted TIM-barrel fold metal-dependent hydrolase